MTTPRKPHDPRAPKPRRIPLRGHDVEACVFCERKPHAYGEFEDESGAPLRRARLWISCQTADCDVRPLTRPLTLENSPNADIKKAIGALARRWNRTGRRHVALDALMLALTKEERRQAQEAAKAQAEPEVVILHNVIPPVGFQPEPCPFCREMPANEGVIRLVQERKYLCMSVVCTNAECSVKPRTAVYNAPLAPATEAEDRLKLEKQALFEWATISATNTKEWLH